VIAATAPVLAAKDSADKTDTAAKKGGSQAK
jgi:hypothetical protein